MILELLPEYQRDPAALSLLYVRSASGELVPLDAVARARAERRARSRSTHSGQLPAVTLSFNLAPGVALGDAVERGRTSSRAQTLPATDHHQLPGHGAGVPVVARRASALLLLMAILVIYIVLGILYESFIHPLTILSALPFAGFGALPRCCSSASSCRIYAFVGVIMLVGIVKKNAIMMIDFALEAQRDEGKSPRDAIYEACLVRFRPIMMTTMAALMGTLPIALGLGAGAESRRPLGLAVVGGLLFSQLLDALRDAGLLPLPRGAPAPALGRRRPRPAPSMM